MNYHPYESMYRWENVPVLDYKEEGSHFKSVSRQLLIEATEGLPFDLRYFEVLPHGHTTLERHEHEHGVMIIRGQGRVLCGQDIRDVKCFDVLKIPSNTWHQFQPVSDEPLGFLCWVKHERDRPHRPDQNELAKLMKVKKIASFIKV